MYKTTMPYITSLQINLVVHSWFQSVFVQLPELCADFAELSVSTEAPSLSHYCTLVHSPWPHPHGVQIIVEPLLMATLSIMATHLGPHSIEIVLIKPLICGHPSKMAKIFGPTGGHYRGFHCNYFFLHIIESRKCKSEVSLTEVLQSGFIQLRKCIKDVFRVEIYFCFLYTLVSDSAKTVTACKELLQTILV